MSVPTSGLPQNCPKPGCSRYFNQTPDEGDQAKAFVMMVVGGVLVAFGTVQLVVAEIVLSLLFLISGAVVFGLGKKWSNEYDTALEGTKNKPSDKKMDLLLDDDLRSVESRAMSRLQLLAEDLDLDSGSLGTFAQADGDRTQAKPLVVIGPDLSSRPAIGKDGTWRFERYRVMVICPTVSPGDLPQRARLPDRKLAPRGDIRVPLRGCGRRNHHLAARAEGEAAS